jgi:hypothetical protein
MSFFPRSANRRSAHDCLHASGFDPPVQENSDRALAGLPCRAAFGQQSHEKPPASWGSVRHGLLFPSNRPWPALDRDPRCESVTRLHPSPDCFQAGHADPKRHKTRRFPDVTCINFGIFMIIQMLASQTCLKKVAI